MDNWSDDDVEQLLPEEVQPESSARKTRQRQRKRGNSWSKKKKQIPVASGLFNEKAVLSFKDNIDLYPYEEDFNPLLTFAKAMDVNRDKRLSPFVHGPLKNVTEKDVEAEGSLEPEDEMGEYVSDEEIMSIESVRSDQEDITLLVEENTQCESASEVNEENSLEYFPGEGDETSDESRDHLDEDVAFQMKVTDQVRQTQEMQFRWILT